MNPHRMAWGSVTQWPVAFAVAIAILLGMLFTRERRGLPMTREMLFLMLLTGCYTFTTLFALVPDEAWRQWQVVMKVLLMTYVTTMLIYGREKIRWLLIVIAGSIAFFGVKGAIFTVVTGGVDRVQGPPDSFLASNNDLGIALVMIIPLLLALYQQTHRTWRRWAILAAAACCGLSAIFTYSRGALVGIAVTGALILLRFQSRFLFSLLLGAVATLIVMFAPDQIFERTQTIGNYEQDASAMQRLQAWSANWNMAVHRPLTGGGFNIAALPDQVWLSYADRKYDNWGDVARAAHSVYFQVLGDHGFVGATIFILLLLGSLLTLQRLIGKVKRVNGLEWIGQFAIAVQTGLFAYMISGAFLSEAYFDLFYAYIALTAILAREYSDSVATLRNTGRATQANEQLRRTELAGVSGRLESQKPR